MYDVEYPSELFGGAVEALMRLPSVGRKGAQRYLLHLLGRSEGDRLRFVEALRGCLLDMGRCPRCHGFSDDGSVCGLCRDPRRDPRLLCVVADMRDTLALDRMGHFRAHYFVLGGLINAISGLHPEQLPIDRLLARVGEGVTEVILALEMSVDGETTSFYLRRRLEPLGVVLSVPARGLGFGESIDQADEVTLSGAMQNRTVLPPLGAGQEAARGVLANK